MENQMDSPASQAIIERKENGQFKEGVSGNPTGKNGMKGLTRWEIRVEQISAKYPTMADLMQFFTLDKFGNLQPAPALLEINHIDAGIIRQLVAGVIGKAKDVREDRESFWDRFQGKPTQTMIVTNPRPEMPQHVKDMTDEQINEYHRTFLMTP